MKMKRLFWGFTMIAALALLAGCGGGGGTSLMIDGVRATQDLIDTATGARDTAREEVTSLQGQLKTANENAMDLQGQLKTANDMIDDLNKQIANAPTQQMIDDLTTMRDKYKKQAEDLQGDLEDEKEKVASLQEQIADLTNPTEDAMAKAIDDAITGTNVRRPTPTTEGLTSLKQITDTSKAAGLTDAAKFRKASVSPPDVLYGGDDNDFLGESYTRTMNGRTDTVTIYTDKQPPSALTFGAFYITRGGNIDGITSIDSNTGSTYGMITFSQNVSELSGRFQASMFPQGNNRAKQYEHSLGASSTSFLGQFHGISGTYTCSGSSCSAQNDANGNLALFSGTWTFDPTINTKATLDAVKVSGVQPDVDYLSFGYWMKEIPRTRGRSTQYQVGAFTEGTDEYGASGTTVNGDVVRSLTETATYTGPAAGMFVRRTLTNAGTSIPTSSGNFTAEAKLIASFGGNAVASDDQYTVSGTIKGFRDAEGLLIDDNWMVTLKRSNKFATSNSFTAAIGGKTDGGGPEGDWSGMLYGNPATVPNIVAPPTQLGTGDVRQSGYNDIVAPTGIAGDFDANFSNGAVIGAFGVTRPRP